MGLSPATKQTIDDIVGDKLCDEEVFTALNVSREVQKRGIRERHRNMRDYIHEAVQKINVYHVKTLVNIGNGLSVNVYHLPEDDPKDYIDNFTVSANKPATPSTTAPVAIPSTTPVKNGITVSPDGRGRICVRASDLRSIGLAEDDEVEISSHPTLNLVTVKKVKPCSAPTGRIYKVDKSGNVRIARRILNKAGIADKNVTVSVVGDDITVEA